MSDREDLSKIFVKSLISKIRSRSWLDQWSRRAVQDAFLLDDLPDTSKVLVVSVIPKISLGSRSGQWSRRSVRDIGQIIIL